MIKKNWFKIVVSFSYIFNSFFCNSIRFTRNNSSSVTKILAGINAKYLPERKYFPLLRILNLFIKLSFNHFDDIALTFSDSSFNTFSTSTCFVLFEVTLV